MEFMCHFGAITVPFMLVTAGVTSAAAGVLTKYFPETGPKVLFYGGLTVFGLVGAYLLGMGQL